MDSFEDDLRDLGEDVEIVYLDDDEVVENEPDEEPIEPESQDDKIEVEVIDLSKLSFNRHTGSVFSSDLSPNNELAVTGGEDDIAYVWTVNNGEIYMECTGHGDSVTEVAFNHDGQYVATGDMGGLIQVWNIAEKKLIWCHEGDDLQWLLWHHSANVLIAGMESGDVFIWQIPQSNCKVLGSHGSPATCGKLLPDGKRVIVGYGDGHIKLWDIKSTSASWQLSDFDDITSIEINTDGSLLAVGPASQVLKVSDGKLIGNYTTGEKSDVEVLTFDDELGILITGSLTGQICIWDIGKKTLRHKAEIEFAVTCFKWGSNGTLLVSTTDGNIYICDVRSGTLLHTLTGHKADVLSMKVSNDKNFVLTTSDDGTAKIFNIKPN